MSDRAVEEIVRLTHDYAFYNDTFQIEPLVELFIEDGVFDLSPAGIARYEGREAVRDYFEREKRALSHLFHLTANHRIDVHGDEASGTVYHLAIGVVRRTGAENPVRGYYDDRYVRTAAGWRFRSRVTFPLLPFEPVRHREGT